MKRARVVGPVTHVRGASTLDADLHVIVKEKLRLKVDRRKTDRSQDMLLTVNKSTKVVIEIR